MEIKEKQIKAKTLTGEVVSDKMDKTCVILITKKLRNPMYHKVYLKTSKIKAHDAHNEYKKGDLVKIVSVKPISKDKAWQIVGKINQEKEVK